MEDISTLNAQQLNKPEVLNGIKQRINELIFYADDEGALALSRQLRAIFKRNDPEVQLEVQNQLKKWAIFVDYLCLPTQSDERILEIFREKAQEVLFLEESILFERLEAKLWTKLSPVREEFGRQIVGALKSNRQKIGPLTLGEWIASYIHAYPERDFLGAFEAKDFLAKNEQARRLSTPDKNTLTKLLKLYNGLHPHEVITQFIKEYPSGVTPEEQAEQAALGQAMQKEQVKGYTDIRKQGGQAREMQEQDARPPTVVTIAPPRPPSVQASVPAAKPASTEEQAISQEFSPPVEKPLATAAPPPPKPVPPPPLGGSSASQFNAAGLSVATLERLAQSGNSIQIDAVRKMINQDFNNLSPEVRRYVLNSPFWAQ